MATKIKVQRLPAEQMFQKEINALIAAEKDPVPTGWKMSPSLCLHILLEERQEKQ